jgi:hypothetical protein
MNTLASVGSGIATNATLARRGPDLRNIAIWLGTSLITVFFALLVRDPTAFDGMYLPFTNDSFYHAHRILDAAVGRGFYQFDDRLHVPEGSWISWPWAYDFLLAKLTQLALWIRPGLDPMAFLSYVAVAWIFVNAALFLACASSIGLSVEMRFLAMLCFALSPLTQLLHAIGMVDHHYIEHTFVLLNVWLGLRWLKAPSETRRAVGLAIALGAAPAFHNGLFILQLVPLTTVFALWLRGHAPPGKALRAFGLALVVTTLLVALPSEPLRAGMFEFGLLSWFHVYVAGCTAAAIAVMSWRPYSRANLAALAALCVALVIPLAPQVLGGAGFLSGKFSILDQISEVKSPYRLFTRTLGPVETASYYSWFLLCAPFLLAFFAYRIFREERPDRLYYAIAVVFGLSLLLDQFRLHVFGLFALVTGGLLLVDEWRASHRRHRGITFVATFALIALAYQPSLRERLLIAYAPGADPEYASGVPAFLDLKRLCAKDPGVVLASSDDGNAILFHSQCSVIANNFILREADKEHIDEVKRLMSLSPAEIHRERPDIKYLFVRAKNFSTIQDDRQVLVADSPIAKQLFIEGAAPNGFTLIRTIVGSIDEHGVAKIYALLYKVSDPAATP